MKVFDLIFATKERRKAEEDYEKARQRLNKINIRVDLKVGRVLEDLREQRIKDSKG